MIRPHRPVHDTWAPANLAALDAVGCVGVGAVAKLLDYANNPL